MRNRKAQFGRGKVILAALLATSAPMTLASQAGPKRLHPVAPPTLPGQLVPKVSLQGQSVKSWRDSLTAKDFVERAAAFDRAVEAVVFDNDLREVLKAWAADRKIGALSWTAFLVLNESRRAPQEVMSGPLGVGRNPIGSIFDGLFAGELGASSFFGVLAPEVFSRQSQSFSLESTPDDVKLRVETKGPDGVETNEYEAKNLKELEGLHPELFAAGGPAAGIRLHSGPQMLFPEMLPGFPRMGFGFSERTPHAIRTDFLGVMAREVTAPEGEPQGILVESVLRGTIAEALGLVGGDVVTRVAGVHIRTTADVRRALAQYPGSGELVVEWTDGSGDDQVGTWRSQAMAE